MLADRAARVMPRTSPFAIVIALAVSSTILARPAAAQGQAAPPAGASSPMTSCTTFSIRSHGEAADNLDIPERPGAKRSIRRLDVQIVCDDSTIFADEVVWESDTEILTATGHVLFEQKGVRVQANRAEFNRTTGLGTFHDVSGTMQLTNRTVEKSLFGTLEPDVFFWGVQVDKTGPKTYRITHGGFTTCVQPTPRWEMSGSTGSLTLDEHAVLRNAVLRVKNVPLLYVPIIYYPINENDRSTGLLLPTYSSSTVRGTGLSNAFFWAIDRSEDATLYHDWFSKTGQGLGADYRYIAAPGSRGTANFYMLDERERLGLDGVTVERPAHRSYDVRGNSNQALPGGFRLVSRVNYFTDISTKQLYNQNIYDLSQRERYLGVTLTGGRRRYRIAASAERRDLFYGSTSAQRDGRAPYVNFSVGEKPIGKSRVYFGANTEVGYLIRQSDLSDPDTNRSLWRFDGAPTIRAPLSSLSFLTVTTSASWRVTRWLESLDPESGTQIPVALTRQLLDLRANAVGPVFSRVFQTPNSGYAERFKHSIEPRFGIRWLSPFARLNEVVQNDYTDAQVGGTTTISYALVNRLAARRKRANGTSEVREILSVTISQSHYSNALAAVADSQYESGQAASSFSPVSIDAVAQPTSSLSARFHTEIDSKFRAIRTLGASGTLNSRVAQVTAGWSKRLVIPGLPGFDNPAAAAHYLNAATTIRRRDNGLGGTYAFNYDVLRGHFLQQRVVAYYNSQCCGVSVDFQSIGIALPSIPRDRRFGISFTLAGIGSFSNPLGSFGR
jgi:LPS-assembly protein